MKIKSKSLKDLKKVQVPKIQLKSIKGGMDGDQSGMAIEKIEIATEKLEVVL